MGAILSADKISFRYNKDWILKEVTFEVTKEAFLGIIGPNASGKTTLLKLLDGLLKPQRGRIFIEDVDLAELGRKDIARKLAVVSQEASPIFFMTTLELVLMGRTPFLGP